MQFINNLLLDMELDPRLVEYLSIIIMILLIGIICIVANFIQENSDQDNTHIVKNSKFKWDKIILERKVFQKLSHIVPAIIIYRLLQPFQPINNYQKIGHCLYNYCRVNGY